MKVLIIDDDVDYLFQQKKELESKGLHVVTHDSSQGVISLIVKEKPHIVFIDLMMEKADSGVLLAEEIRKNFPDLKLVALTNISLLGYELKDAHPWLKVDRILNKPVRSDQLLHTIENLKKMSAPKNEQAS